MAWHRIFTLYGRELKEEVELKNCIDMEPLYDRNSELVGWMDREHQNIYDKDMEGIATVFNGNAYSYESQEWLGPVNGYNVLDRDGKVVAWSPKQMVQGMSERPEEPVNSPTQFPQRPASADPREDIDIPERPAEPAEGWSNLEMHEWVMA